MGIQTTLILYIIIGAGVAVAVFVRSGPAVGTAWLQACAACAFWPLYVPLLLGRPAPNDSMPSLSTDRASEAPPPDEMALAIECVETELHDALDRLDGWAELTLAGELARIDELQDAWRLQAARIRELTGLLESTTPESVPLTESWGGETSGLERVRSSGQARRANFERLREIRDQMHGDLMSTLAWVRELVSMIHVARYTGAPASRAEDLVSQIATAVEGFREVTELQAAAPSLPFGPRYHSCRDYSSGA